MKDTDYLVMERKNENECTYWGEHMEPRIVQRCSSLKTAKSLVWTIRNRRTRFIVMPDGSRSFLERGRGVGKLAQCGWYWTTFPG